MLPGPGTSTFGPGPISWRSWACWTAVRSDLPAARLPESLADRCFRGRARRCFRDRVLRRSDPGLSAGGPGLAGRRSDLICLPHDYLNLWLTGAFVAEPGDASGTGYFDVRTRAYQLEVLGLLDGGQI